MPKIAREDIPFPDYDAFQHAFFRGRSFRAQVMRVLEDAHLCAEPLPYLRLLQTLVRPSWEVEYRPATNDYRRLVDGLLPVLEQISARAVLFPWADVPEGADHIRMSYHTVGQRKNRWHYKAGYLPDYLSFDQGGFSGWSSLYELEADKLQRYPVDVVDSFYDKASSDYRENLRSKYKQAKPESIDQNDFIFIPMQVVNDVVISLKLFPQTYLDAIKTVVKLLSEAGHTVVIKRHPMCEDRGVDKFVRTVGSDRIIVSTASVHTLLPKAKCVVTLNSGVGFEALMYLKPVVCLGKADYSKAGVEVAEPDDIVTAVDKAVTSLDPDLVKRVVYAALNIYQLDTRSSLAFERHALRALSQYFLIKGPR